MCCLCPLASCSGPNLCQLHVLSALAPACGLDLLPSLVWDNVKSSFAVSGLKWSFPRSASTCVTWQLCSPLPWKKVEWLAVAGNKRHRDKIGIGNRDSQFHMSGIWADLIELNWIELSWIELNKFRVSARSGIGGRKSFNLSIEKTC